MTMLPDHYTNLESTHGRTRRETMLLHIVLVENIAYCGIYSLRSKSAEY